MEKDIKGRCALTVALNITQCNCDELETLKKCPKICQCDTTF